MGFVIFLVTKILNIIVEVIRSMWIYLRIIKNYSLNFELLIEFQWTKDERIILDEKLVFSSKLHNFYGYLPRNSIIGFNCDN